MTSTLNAGWLASALLATGVAAAQPVPLRGLTLQDHRAQPLQAAALAGRPTLMHAVFTQCSSTCPLQVRELAAVHEALPAAVRAQVRFVSVSVDPLSDTPKTLAAFAQKQGADRPGWHFATGQPAQVALLIDRLQLYPADKTQPRPEDHRSSLYLFGADGQLVQRFRGVLVDRARLVDEISRLAVSAQR